MSEALVIGLKFLRRIYAIFFGRSKNRKQERIEVADEASSFIVYDALMSDQACMIAGFRSTEFNCLVNYRAVKDNTRSYLKYIKGKIPSWWWDKSITKNLCLFGTFFPKEESKIEQFCELLEHDMVEVDVLFSRLSYEGLFHKELANSKKINFELLNPYFTKIRWTQALKGKKVLIIHPLAVIIQQQYLKRNLLLKNYLLPSFELKILQPSLSIAENTVLFKDWFAVLENLKSEIDRHDYEICLIGDCGAYGFPLAAHVKRSGKKSIELGGNLQLLFGIRDK